MDCCECGVEIGNGWTFYEEVTGWSKRRSGGGSSSTVTRRSPTGRVRCRGCMEASTLPAGQMTMFGDD